MAESLLSDPRGDERADAVLSRLEVSDVSTPAPDAQALGAYCAAAGEAMRLARSGSQAQAQSYLLSAIRYSEAAGDRSTAARAALRLGLASVTPVSVAGARGRRSAQAPEAAVEPLPPPPDADYDLCEELLKPRFLRAPASDATHFALRCAVDRAREAGNFEVAARAQLRLAQMSLRRADRGAGSRDELKAQAGLLAQAGLADAAMIANPSLRAELIGRLADQAIEAGLAGDAAVAAAPDAIRASAADAAGQAVAAALGSKIALARGDRARARALAQEAVFLESQRPQPLRLPSWLLLLAEADPDRRDEHILQAYRALERVRTLLPVRDPLTEESTFSAMMRPVFEAAVEVQLAGLGRADEPARIAGAQSIIEAFREAELQSVFGSNCVPPRNPITPADLRPGEILLYPILLRDRVELIYAERNGAEVPVFSRLATSNQAGREEVARLVNAVAASVAYGQDDSWRGPARDLYRLLVRPLEGRLNGSSTLVIVPDGPLRALPFAALVDDKGKFLIERTGLSVAPALAYSEAGERHKDQPVVVAASLEEDVKLPSGFFPALAGADDEAKVAAGSGLPGARGLFLEDFSRSDLNRTMAAARPDVLHLATHAAFNGRSDRSFIVANGDAIPIAELRGLLGKRSGSELLDLIVLSACETAVGDDQASMGLAGAAVQAGARSAIASLWQVNDAGTVELMKNFYSSYRGGQGKAEALRSAQLALITKGGDYADPGIWGAFTLLGAWR